MLLENHDIRVEVPEIPKPDCPDECTVWQYRVQSSSATLSKGSKVTFYKLKIKNTFIGLFFRKAVI